MKFRQLTAILALLLAIGLTMPAPAQQQDETPSGASYSKQELQQFADAHSAVMEIRDEYTQRLQQAEDRDRAMELQEEANERMVEAVTDTGLSVERYGQIARQAASDTELSERIQGMME